MCYHRGVNAKVSTVLPLIIYQELSRRRSAARIRSIQSTPVYTYTSPLTSGMADAEVSRSVWCQCTQTDVKKHLQHLWPKYGTGRKDVIIIVVLAVISNYSLH